MGLIGGLSWESSLEYYRIINQTAQAKLGGLHSAKCLMYSVNFQEIAVLQHQNKWDELTEVMVDIARNLKKAGADFIVICTNTMHKMAKEIEEQAEIKVFHIAEATGKRIVDRGFKKVGLLGTKFTMEGDFYKQVLKDQQNIDVIIPDEAEREFIHGVIFDELCKGIINPQSRDKFVQIINHLAAKGAEGVVLGCTEIPLLVKQQDVKIPVFDTTTIHATAALEYALE